MSDKLESALAQAESALAQLPKSSEAPQPVGHKPPFTGDFNTMVHCFTEAVRLGRAGELKNESLYTHAAQALGEAAVLAPLETDGPQPVGGGIPWLQLILLLIQALGETGE